MPTQLAILGAGNMAEAIVRGVAGAGLIAPQDIVAADPSEARLDFFRGELETRTTTDNAEAVRDASQILLAVKPQMLGSVLESLPLPNGVLLISIAAGITTAFIESKAPAARVVRVMPNTPMLVGQGMSAVCAGSRATPDDLANVRKLFESAGKVIEVSESQIDAVTAVSGSGPAYFFYLTEQMIKAGVALGLSLEDAKILATQTAVGSAKMLTGHDSAEELRKKVTSPNGTTHAAVTHLDSHGVAHTIREAIAKAAARSKELSAT